MFGVANQLLASAALCSEACAPRLDADGQADLAQMKALYASWSKEVEAAGWGIATLDKHAAAYTPPVSETLAHYTLTPAELAILRAPSIPYNLDAWDGYAVAREQVTGWALTQVQSGAPLTEVTVRPVGMVSETEMGPVVGPSHTLLDMVATSTFFLAA